MWGGGGLKKRAGRNIKTNHIRGGSFLLSDLQLIRHLAVDKMIPPLNTRKLHPVSQSRCNHPKQKSGLPSKTNMEFNLCDALNVAN